MFSQAARWWRCWGLGCALITASGCVGSVPDDSTEGEASSLSRASSTLLAPERGRRMPLAGANTALTPSNLSATTCGTPGATDLIVPAGAYVHIGTDSGCDEKITQLDAPEICVRKFGEVVIHGTLTASGARVLALVATGSFTVDGTIDISGRHFWVPAGMSTKFKGGGYGTPSGGGVPAFGNPELIRIRFADPVSSWVEDCPTIGG